MQNHEIQSRRIELKTDPAAFDAVFEGRKTFEIRYNDRDYRVGDHLVLRKTTYTGEAMTAGAPLIYTGDECELEVTHVQRGPMYGLADGWALLSICARSSDYPSDKTMERTQCSGGDAEFLAKPLKRVAALAGVPIPEDFSAHCAGAILGRIATALEEQGTARWGRTQARSTPPYGRPQAHRPVVGQCAP